MHLLGRWQPCLCSNGKHDRFQFDLENLKRNALAQQEPRAKQSPVSPKVREVNEDSSTLFVIIQDCICMILSTSLLLY
eukprot:6326160-Amphidinium_carterae.1